jgi:hypothetical protein
MQMIKEISMKTKQGTRIALAILMAAMAITLAACVTSNLSRAVKTTNSIQDVDREIRAIVIQIETVAASLEALMVPGQPDLRRLYERFAGEIIRLEAQGNLVIAREAEMNASSLAYFAEWERQGTTYTNPRIQALSEERRIKLSQIFDNVARANTGIRDHYFVYLADLKEIRLYLSNDLTPDGIKAIETIARQTLQHLAALRASLQPVIEALDAIRLELYSQPEA